MSTIPPPPPAGWQPGQPAPQAPRTNGFAIAALVTSLLCFAPLGIIFGHISLNQIKKTGEQGHGLALAGLIIGYVGIAGWVLYAGAIIALLASSGN